jgi:hypothetical protein
MSSLLVFDRVYRLKIQLPEFIDPVLGVNMIVFAKISPKRSFSIQSAPIDAGLGLFWTRSDWGVVFKYWSCVEGEISARIYIEVVFIFKTS